MTIAIYGNRRQQPYLDLIVRLLDTLRRRGVTIVMHRKLHAYLEDALGRILLEGQRVAGDDERPEADMVMSIGGDGTFLNTARWVGTRQTPIIGVNTGHLGYLSAFSIHDAPEGVAELLAGRYTVEERSMLQVTTREACIAWPYALNEVAILKRDTSSMLNVETTVNGHLLATYRADGLLISTPTGSTGYNLSAGGPILQPTTPALVIAPIAPHSLSMRPVVIDDRSSITCVTDTRVDHYLLSLDGRSVPLPVGSAVTINRAPFITRVVHLDKDYSFATALHQKLHWGS